MRTTIPPPPSIRLSITLPSVLHARLTELARLQRLSVSATIVEWLTDTQGALDTMTELLRDVRERPAEAIAKLDRHAAALSVVAGETIDAIRAGAGAADALARREPPPPSNTGGYLPAHKGKRKGKAG